MSEGTKIQWTEETWNPTAGCSKISPGCKNCYAIKDAVRLSGNQNSKISEKYAGTVSWYNETGKANWTGRINLASLETLLKPYYWTRSRRIFVNSMSDLFHENIPFEWIDKVFSIMALSPQHTFQVLTKRAERMYEYFESFKFYPVYERGVTNGNWLRNILNEDAVTAVAKANFAKGLPNVWLGVSVENQKTADERIPFLLKTPAKIRFLSCEPLLDKVQLFPAYLPCETIGGVELENFIDWVIVGGESGINPRPFHLEHGLQIIQQCKSANVPVFFKQAGSFCVTENVNLFDFPEEPKFADWGDSAASARIKFNDRKGGELTELPEEFRVRQFPKI